MTASIWRGIGVLIVERFTSAIFCSFAFAFALNVEAVVAICIVAESSFFLVILHTLYQFTLQGGCLTGVAYRHQSW